MTRREKDSDVASEEPGSTLADAINAHLALKKEHGASADEIERERESALAPPRRDLDPSADLNTPPPESPSPPESAPHAERPQRSEISSPEQPSPPNTPPPADAGAPLPPEPEIPRVEPEPDFEIEEPSVESAPAPGEVTGNFEFEFGEQQSAEVPSPKPPTEPSTSNASDVLEQTPEFFEETPEYDRLWFEERSPRDFDF